MGSICFSGDTAQMHSIFLVCGIDLLVPTSSIIDVV